jgi:AraC-like DNA-binding protein
MLNSQSLIRSRTDVMISPLRCPLSGEREASQSPIRVSSMQVRALCEGVAQAGVRAPALLVEAGLEPRSLEDTQAWFSLDDFDRLMVAAVVMTKEAAFGLHWGRCAPMAQFDQLTTLAASAPSLRAVFECAARFQPLLATRSEYRFHEQADECRVSFDVLALSEQGVRTRTEFLLGATQRLLQYFGAAHALRGITVPYAPPDYSKAYVDAFGPIVEFGCSTTRLTFVAAALDRIQSLRNPELHEFLRERIEHLRSGALSLMTITEQTEALIRAHLPKVPSIAEAASSFDMSERSLRRMLARDNTSYSAVVERVRREVADAMLATGRPSTKEMASALGYGDVTAFHRAFRRWTGDTPGRMRTPRARHD